MPEIVESRERLIDLARDGALRGHTYRDLRGSGLRVERGDFEGSTFERVSLDEADLTAASLARASFVQADLRKARLDANSRWMAGFLEANGLAPFFVNCIAVGISIWQSSADGILPGLKKGCF